MFQALQDLISLALRKTGDPRLSPFGSWDMLQLTHNPDKDGWM